MSSIGSGNGKGGNRFSFSSQSSRWSLQDVSLTSRAQNSAAPMDYLDFAAFQNFVKLLKRRAEIDDLFSRQLSSPDASGLSLVDWSRFLVNVQQVSSAPRDFDSLLIFVQFTSVDPMIAKLHVKYAEPGLDVVTLDGFNAFLLSSDNAPIRDDSQQDMSRPLCEYYISSSHNVRQSHSISAVTDLSTDLPRRKPNTRTKYSRGIYSSAAARLSMCRT